MIGNLGHCWSEESVEDGGVLVGGGRLRRVVTTRDPCKAVATLKNHQWNFKYQTNKGMNTGLPGGRRWGGEALECL